MQRIYTVIKKGACILALLAIVIGTPYGIYKIYKISKGSLPDKEIEMVTSDKLNDKEKMYYRQYLSYRDYAATSCYTEDEFQSKIISKFGSEKEYMTDTLRHLIIENNWESEEEAIEISETIADKIYG